MVWFARSTHQLLIGVRPYWQALVAFGGVGSFCPCRAISQVGSAHSAGVLPALEVERWSRGRDIKSEVHAGRKIIQALAEKCSTIDRRSRCNLQRVMSFHKQGKLKAVPSIVTCDSVVCSVCIVCNICTDYRVACVAAVSDSGEGSGTAAQRDSRTAVDIVQLFHPCQLHCTQSIMSTETPTGIHWLDAIKGQSFRDISIDDTQGIKTEEFIRACRSMITLFGIHTLTLHADFQI